MNRFKYAINKIRTDIAGAFWFLAFCAVLGALAAWAGIFTVVAWIKAPVLCFVLFVAAVVAWFEREYRKPDVRTIKTLNDAGNVFFNVGDVLAELGIDGGRVVVSNDKYELRLYAKSESKAESDDD